MSVYGSPAIDLLFFFGGNPFDTIRTDNRELLLREYHNSLTNSMAKLNCTTEAPSFDDLQNTVKDRGAFEAITSFALLPDLLLDKSQSKNLDELLDTDVEDHVKAYRTNEFKKVMSRLLPLYDNLGLLDD